MTQFFYTLIIFASFGGFFLATYIRHRKSSNEKLICLIGSDCDSVVHSKYSVFFGIPVEILGLVYYGIIGISYGFFLAMPGLVLPSVLFLVLSFSAIAVLFSIYLTFIQIRVLEQLCTWCLISAGLCTLIFIFALVGSQYSPTDLLEFYYSLIV